MSDGSERPLTGDFRSDGRPLDMGEYERAGGYLAIRRALKEMSPAEVMNEVKASRLRGRGGAGFPTGLKWSFVPAGEGQDATGPRYIIANADEMEPGAFKDRILMESNPHMLMEGLLLGAYAIGAGCAYIFLRGEYGRAAKAIERALAEAYEKNHLGKDILGSDFSLEMRLHMSAGRYMCGEETGLINSIEGKRAIPRAKPPYPQVCGFMGRPTVVNNVETLCNVPHIIRNGAEWYKGLSQKLSADGGTKIYGASGRLKRPGAWELPLGTTAREILEEHAGGMREGFRFRGLLPGGASTEFILEEHLDVRMDFDSVQSVGSRMGTGTMVVLDDRTCPVGMQLSLQKFFARESCGWCTPCREGLPWVVHMLRAIEAGEGEMEDIDLLLEQARLLAPGHTFCALAPGAAEPLGSGVKYFREDFERHIREKRCPWKIKSL
ncbi:MAG: NADH-quinone oxidoreductase subunit NuoF [Nitrospiraceae bacterium]|nr:NADH-quinone oxidoreductase subunit NuoF [Nitrospiraceae bacterium]